jgi:DNA-binding CsgD family transcriptional regulator
MRRERLAANLLERLGGEAHRTKTLAGFRAMVLESLGERFCADSGAIGDPPWQALTEADRFTGFGSSADFTAQWIENQQRYVRSIGRYFRAIQAGPLPDSAVYDGWERRRLAIYREVFLPQRATSVIAAAITYRGRDLACVILKRHGRHGQRKPFGSGDANALASLVGTVALLDAGFQSLSAPAAQRSGSPTVLARLAHREMEVASLAGRGMTNVEIAELLGTSCETVKKQMRSIFAKVGVSNRAELAAMWASFRPSSD